MAPSRTASGLTPASAGTSVRKDSRRWSTRFSVLERVYPADFLSILSARKIIRYYGRLFRRPKAPTPSKPRRFPSPRFAEETVARACRALTDRDQSTSL
jgi:hypothetical protein